MLRQGAQALDPATAHSGGHPGRCPEGALLPEEPGQQLPLLKVLEAVLLGCKRPCEAECEGQDPGTQVLGLPHMEEQLHQAGVFLQ